LAVRRYGFLPISPVAISLMETGGWIAVVSASSTAEVLMIGLLDRDTEMAASYALAAAPQDDSSSTSTPVDPVNAITGDDPAMGPGSILQHVAATLPALDVPLQGTDVVDTLSPELGGASDASTLSGFDLLGQGGQSPLVLAGNDGTLQPIFGAANTTVLDVHEELNGLAGEVGLPSTVHGITNLGETVGLGFIGNAHEPNGATNTITDTLNLPSELANGDLNAVVTNLGTDLTQVVNAVSELKDAVIFGADPLNPVGDIIRDVGSDLQNIPLLSVNGGNNTNDGGLLGGFVGSLNDPSSGHLVDLDVGPQQNSHGLNLNLLSQPDTGAQHPLSVSAIDVAPGSPQLLDLGVLTGGTYGLPSLGGTGSGGLLGSLPLNNVLGGNLLGGGIASGNTASAPVSAPIGLDAPVHDLVTGPIANDHGLLNLHGTHII
jgi:hypothetical protein